MKKGIIQERRADVICILADWPNVAEGIFFTDKAMYASYPKNSSKSFRVEYGEIKSLEYRQSVPDWRIREEAQHLDCMQRIKTAIETVSVSFHIDIPCDKHLASGDLLPTAWCFFCISCRIGLITTG
ncbi:hypothetical protein [Paenibacillus sp. DYY-L-2]|uniref:hypothetical protein n=1 Tax=Paenibacillus sp. DYY-L-2 TaxID=3447013 RepID=UPI003F4FD397